MVEISQKLVEACQHTSRVHNFLSDCRNFNLFSVLKTRHPNLSRDIKISSAEVWKDLQICL